MKILWIFGVSATVPTYGTAYVADVINIYIYICILSGEKPGGLLLLSCIWDVFVRVCFTYGSKFYSANKYICIRVVLSFEILNKVFFIVLFMVIPHVYYLAGSNQWKFCSSCIATG